MKDTSIAFSDNKKRITTPSLGELIESVSDLWVLVIYLLPNIKEPGILSYNVYVGQVKLIM